MAKAMSTEELIKQMQAKLVEQNEILEQLTQPPATYGTVLRVGDTVTVLTGGAPIEVAKPKDFRLKGLEAGDSVLLNKMSQIIQIAPEVPAYGAIAAVSRLVDEHSSEITTDGQTKVVMNGTSKPKVGDQVVLDASNIMIRLVLPADEGKQYKMQTEVSVSWEDVGGHSVAKAALQDAIVLPKLHPSIFAHYNKRYPGGILLYGPPGNGKTLLGKAVATALRVESGEKGGFFSLKGPEILDPYVGEAERKLRGLFRASKTHKAKTGNPGVIFIDEAEALFSKRGSGISSDMERTIVPTLLAEMDGLEESSAIVILATNRPEQMDEAVVRDGRVDRKIEVPRPSPEDAAEIVGIHLQKTPIADGEDRHEIAALAVQEVYDAKRTIAGGKTMRDITSGAMLAGITEHAKTIALRRDLDKGGTPTGVSKPDMLAAIARVQAENQRISHAA